MPSRACTPTIIVSDGFERARVRSFAASFGVALPTRALRTPRALALRAQESAQSRNERDSVPTLAYRTGWASARSWRSPSQPWKTLLSPAPRRKGKAETRCEARTRPRAPHVDPLRFVPCTAPEIRSAVVADA